MAVSLTSSIGEVRIDPCIMNASGPLCTSMDELEAIAKSGAGAIVLKTSTVEKREGNQTPKYYENDILSINSMGLPNLGYKRACENVLSLKKFEKPIVASIAGFTPKEYVDMCMAFDEASADILEVNLSCPNLEGKCQAAYDFEYANEVLGQVRDCTSRPIAVKLPPYLEVMHREEMAKILVENRVEAAVLVNSPGNAMVVDLQNQSAVIRPKGGLGGLGGPVIKPIALGNVYSFYKTMGEKCKVIGVGGIWSAEDVFEHILCGASSVQIATVFARKGIGIFEKLRLDLQNILENRGYDSIEEFRGKIAVAQEDKNYPFAVK